MMCASAEKSSDSLQCYAFNIATKTKAFRSWKSSIWLTSRSFFLAKRLVKSYKWIMECLNVLMVSVFGVIEWQILHTAIEHIFVHFGMCEWFEVGINHREKKNNHLWPSVDLSDPIYLTDDSLIETFVFACLNFVCQSELSMWSISFCSW